MSELRKNKRLQVTRSVRAHRMLPVLCLNYIILECLKSQFEELKEVPCGPGGVQEGWCGCMEGDEIEARETDRSQVIRALFVMLKSLDFILKLPGSH